MCPKTRSRTVEGKVAVTDANAADIKKLSIVTVRHKNAATDFEFGTADLDEVTLCY